MDIGTTDLGYGDAGKGRTVHRLVTHYLQQGYKTINVVKYCGGNQAGHNVILNGIHHLFSNLGSGSFCQANTIITPLSLSNPFTIIHEMEDFEQETSINLNGKIFVHENVPIITPYHTMLSNISSYATNHFKGSIGYGVGSAYKDYQQNSDSVLCYRDFSNLSIFNDKLIQIEKRIKNKIVKIKNENPFNLKEIQETENWFKINFFDQLFAYYIDYFKRNRFQIINENTMQQMINQGVNIYEGTQGLLIDKDHGFKPHITSTSLLTNNISKITSKPYKVLGITRTHAVRHGPGYFPTESSKVIVNERYDYDGVFNGPMRHGYLCLPLLKKATKINPIDYLAITHLDWPKYPIEICVDFQEIDEQKNLYNNPILQTIYSEDQLLETIENCLKVPIIFKSYTYESKDDRPCAFI